MNEDETRDIAKVLGWEIAIVSMKACKAFSVGNSKQKNLSNNSDYDPVKKNAELIFIDNSRVKVKKDGPPVQ